MGDVKTQIGTCGLRQRGLSLQTVAKSDRRGIISRVAREQVAKRAAAYNKGAAVFVKMETRGPSEFFGREDFRAASEILPDGCCGYTPDVNGIPREFRNVFPPEN